MQIAERSSRSNDAESRRALSIAFVLFSILFVARWTKINVEAIIVMAIAMTASVIINSISVAPRFEFTDVVVTVVTVPSPTTRCAQMPCHSRRRS